MNGGYTQAPTDKRFWEIDAFRGTAVIMMIVFHLAFDLNFFNIYSINVISGFWRFFAYCTAFIFIFIAGVSLNINMSRHPFESKQEWFYLKYIKRGAFIFFLGIIITVTTWVVVREGYIIFGILHCIGSSIVIGSLFFRYPKLQLITAILCIGASFSLSTIHGPLILAWIGIHPVDFYSLDYFPLLPWFGIMLLGINVGHHLYLNGQRKFSIKNTSALVPTSLCWLGRHSLIIYLAHQPIMISLLSLVFPDLVWVQLHFF